MEVVAGDDEGIAEARCRAYVQKGEVPHPDLRLQEQFDEGI